MRNTIWMALLGWSWISSCEKPAKAPDYTTPVNDTIKQVVFDVGSWWAYQRTSNNAIDTVFVKSLKHDTAKYVYDNEGYNVEYYKVTYRIAGNGKEYSCYYYLDRAKFNCSEPRLLQTGQEFFFTNRLNGKGKEGKANCCYLIENEIYKTFNNMTFNTVSMYEIWSYCQWDSNLFTQGTNYYFNTDVGFLRFYLAGSLGWETDFYTIKGYHVVHI